MREIRTSDWLHRRLTNAPPLALADGLRPKDHTPVPRGTGGCRAATPCDALSENAPPFHTPPYQPPPNLLPHPPTGTIFPPPPASLSAPALPPPPPPP